MQADSGKHGDSGSSPILQSAEADVFDDECMGQVPDSYWAVPQMPSPPTASGLYWPKDSQNQSDGMVFVPDMSRSSAKSHFHSSHIGSIPKRRRQT
ncbi:hypothetical protein V6N11_079125 [Hibiscus sabdariffa]|uniref:Uncharacterized protein n=1 Tax=Hibiscus sabdariffa TaxID=183260 RepID=A0ABR2RUG8_9ROSI